ncbi:DNA polymerase III subunit psi [[Pantoea] beijingensis]|uniref:DNA polymerase III subunit psi n=1 Tax=[Pantoea] beijingensis TaxID=1324864 RepID=A0A443IAJ3_9GAMM|nr:MULTISPECIES: DNA polymerase III subunit psi [Erwiniaceae]RWR00917.1 DNA polymerase III subunit psi [[Pantoea] beijingensis]
MSSRRDWLLQQMGITQYTLRRPRALQGEIALALPTDTRLLIVASVPPSTEDPLVSDVLRSLTLAPHEVVILTPDRLAMLPEERQCASWLLGVDETIAIKGVQLSSPALDELYHNADAKRALWQQICEYESDFFTHIERS